MERHSRRLPCTILLSVSVLAASLIIANAITTRPLLKVETLEPPLAMANVPCDARAGQLTGPFRPRPKPPEPPPAPVPENDAERKLFPRIEALINSRAAAIEERATKRVEEALDEVGDNMNLAIEGNPLVQGSFGAVFVQKLVTFVKKAVEMLIAALLLTVIGALMVKYWFIVGPVGLFLFVALPAWSARTFAKKTPGA